MIIWILIALITMLLAIALFISGKVTNKKLVVIGVCLVIMVISIVKVGKQVEENNFKKSEFGQVIQFENE